jgi:hypothetical protein
MPKRKPPPTELEELVNLLRADESFFRPITDLAWVERSEELHSILTDQATKDWPTLSLEQSIILKVGMVVDDVLARSGHAETGEEWRKCFSFDVHQISQLARQNRFHEPVDRLPIDALAIAKDAEAVLHKLWVLFTVMKVYREYGKEIPLESVFICAWSAGMSEGTMLLRHEETRARRGKRAMETTLEAAEARSDMAYPQHEDWAKRFVELRRDDPKLTANRAAPRIKMIEGAWQSPGQIRKVLRKWEGEGWLPED